MAVNFQVVASGQKTATTGTTFTIALSSTASDLVVVAVATTSNGNTVSSITDGGGNQYRKVNSVVNGTTLNVELWKTDKVNPAASGTLTVTLSASGFRAGGVAASYRNVAFAGEAAATNTGAGSPLTSASTTLRETLGTGELVMAGAIAANNAFTVQNGHLRGQTTGTTALRVMLMDSEGNTSPVTDSSTMSAGNWGMVKLELRPLAITDTVTLSDAKTPVLGQTEIAADVLELKDADGTGTLTGIENLVPGGFAHWDEVIRYQMTNSVTSVTIQGIPLCDGMQRAIVTAVDPVGKVVTATSEVWKDGTPTEQFDFMLSLICPHLNNWLDVLGAGYGALASDQLVLVDSLGAGYGGLLSDNEGGNWADAFGYNSPVLEALTDSLNNWADASLTLSLLYQVTMNDVMNFWSDTKTTVVGFQLALTDSETGNWLDALAAAVSFAVLLSDNEGANWSDVLRVGYGNVETDALTMSDFAGLGYGSLTSDQLILVDSLGAGYGGLFSDVLTWTDALGAGYGNALIDTLNSWTDATTVGYGNVLTDNLNSWLDASPNIQLQFQLTINQSMNFWLDAFGSQLIGNVVELDEVLSDSDVANWLDALGAGYGNASSDTLVMTDFVGAGYGSATSDQLILVDSLGAGYGGLLSDTLVLSDSLGLGYGNLLNDSLNNWSDLLSFIFGFSLLIADTLNSWADSLAVGYGNAETDTLVMTDFVGAGYGSATSDQIVLVDSLGAGYGALLSDTLNLWQDLFTAIASFAIQLSDTLNAWLDALSVGYGSQITDALAFSDFVAAGYGSATSDQLILADSLGAGYGAQLSDSLNLWQDFFASIFGLNAQLTDTLNLWADALAVGYGNQIADTLVMVDFVGAGYGSVTSDQLIIADSLGAGYGAQLSDSDSANWLDAFNELLQGTIISEQLSDSLNNWADAMFAGYGSSTSDQLILTDSLNAGYGGLLSDNLNSWADVTPVRQLQFQLTINQSMNAWIDVLAVGFGASVADALTMSDALSAGYGAFTSDQLVIVDSLGAGYGALLSDSESANWLDAFAEAFGGGTVISEVLSDSLNFWSDVLVVGYGNLTTDAITWSDNLGAGYGNAELDSLTMTDTMTAGYGVLTSDQLVIVESVSAGYGALLSDSESGNWSDLLQFVSPVTILLTDSLNFWLDALAVGYGLLEQDQFIYQDSMAAGYGLLTSEQLPMLDTLGIGYGFLIADSLNVWLDAIQATLVMGASLVLSDSMNFWNDTVIESFLTAVFAAKYRLATVKQHVSVVTVLAEPKIDPTGDVLSKIAVGPVLVQQSTKVSVEVAASLQLGKLAFNLPLYDNMTFSDVYLSQLNTQQAAPADSLNFWNDSLLMMLGLRFGDSAADWIDEIAVGGTLQPYQITFTDVVVLQDAIGSQFGHNLMDALSMSDSFGVHYGLSLVDVASGNWLDDYKFTFDMTEKFGDSVSWSDVLVQFTPGTNFADASNMTDQLSLAVGMMLGDSTTDNWNDGFALAGIIVPYQLAVSDTVTMSDAANRFAAYSPGFIDSIAMQDGFAYGLSLPLKVVDGLNYWQDGTPNVMVN